MDRMMYVAMSGARQIMHKQATNSHNLANQSTTGFKADIDKFKAVPVYGPGHPGRVYTEDQRTGIDHTPGQLRHTGVPLDIAIDGNGFIAIQDIDGEEAYTRNGHLSVTEQGLLTTDRGDPVLGDGGPITLTPYEKVFIGNDGTITIQPLGQTAGELVVLDRIKLVNPELDSIERNKRGLFVTENREEPADAEVKLATETLETSNVNSISALVTMIELSRQYETQVKLMSAAEKNDVAAGKLLNLN